MEIKDQVINVYDTKLSNLKLKCKSHGSPVGGVCDNMECSNLNNQLLCVKCLLDKNCCISSKKHNLISINEFIDKFKKEITFFKSDFNYSKSLKKLDFFISNTDKIVSDFETQINNFKSSINNIFNESIDFMKTKQEKFNSTFEQIYIEKQKSLKDSFSYLNEIFDSEYLTKFDANNLKSKILKMPNENIARTLSSLKKTVVNLQNNTHLNPSNNIDSIILLTTKEYSEKLNSLFETNKTQLNENLDKLISNIESEIFNTRVKIKKLGNLKLESEFCVDWSSNSIFTNKKFIIFENNCGNTILAYPTSQHTIKLENFSLFFTKEHKLNVDSFNNYINNEAFRKESNLNYRDCYLMLNLKSHKNEITNISYFKNEISKFEYIITSSKDKTIKIWDITNFTDYENISSLVKTLKHENSVTAYDYFLNNLDSTPYLVSCSENEKIKIWNITTGELIRPLNEECCNNNLIKIVEYENKYFLITSSYKNINEKQKVEFYSPQIQIYDFVSGNKIISLSPYEKLDSNNKFKFVSILPYEESEFLLIDNLGSSFALNFSSFEVHSMDLDTFKTERVGAIKWKEHLIYIYCKNGIIYEYNLDQRKFISKLRTDSHSVTHITKFNYLSKEILLTHNTSQKLKIFS